MERQMDIAFRLISYYIANALIATKKILEKEKPKLVIVDSEANFYSKSLIQNTKKMDIKSIALQFGPILKEGSDIPLNNEIFPDIKCVDGPSAKYNLIKYYNYPKSMIKITGEPRYDLLSKNNWNKNQILKEIGLEHSKKTILFIDPGMIDRKFIDILYKAFKKFGLDKRIQFVIKLHPHDNYNHKIFKKFSRKNIKILKEYNISKLVYVSEVILNVWSTVSIEAIIANKPLLLINFNHMYPNLFPFDKEGSAIRVYSKEELIKYTYLCLYNQKIQEELAAGRKISLNKHYYKLPGKASELIIEELKILLK